MRRVYHKFPLQSHVRTTRDGQSTLADVSHCVGGTISVSSSIACDHRGGVGR